MRLKRLKKGKEYQTGQQYLYTDYIHPSYFKMMDAQTTQIECAYCQKPQGATKFEFCSVCKKVYYCSKDCQVKHWKAGHKTICGKPKHKP